MGASGCPEALLFFGEASVDGQMRQAHRHQAHTEEARLIDEEKGLRGIRRLDEFCYF